MNISTMLCLFWKSYRYPRFFQPQVQKHKTTKGWSFLKMHGIIKTEQSALQKKQGGIFDETFHW